MRPKKPETTGEGDLFRARLDQIINLKHELVQLGGKIDWDWIDREIAPLYSEKGRPGIESRFVIGLLLLKHIYGLSDEDVCERWVYDPYFQYFTGEEFSSTSSRTSEATLATGASGLATSWSFCWPRA
jgi:IS5 family transposase